MDINGVSDRSLICFGGYLVASLVILGAGGHNQEIDFESVCAMLGAAPLGWYCAARDFDERGGRPPRHADYEDSP